ncbi:MAG: hypothetical protein VX546_05410, partial [Myxococcota bacterium]|nr:hypothetical protein [Myxococcota bacterium]
AAQVASEPAGKSTAPREGQRRLVRPKASATPPVSAGEAQLPREILIVASRLKSYILARSGMNTSDRVLAPLSEILRRVCDEAIENARREERKTVLDRDIPRPE